MIDALERRLPWLFVALGLPLALFCAVGIPLGQAPDELAHMVRARALAEGQWIGRRETIPHPADGRPLVAAGVDTDPALFDAVFESPGVPVTRDAWAAKAAVEWTGKHRFWEAPNSAVNPPIFYLPAAAALSIPGARPFHAARLARAANALLYAAIGLLALGLARRGRRVLFAALLVPMSLSLAGSLNPDGLIIAFAMLAAALATRIEAGGGITGWVAALVFACVIAAKPPYAPLAALLLLPRVSRRTRLGLMLVALVPGVLWWAVASASTWTPFWRLPYHGGPYWHGDPAHVFRTTDPSAQLAILLRNPTLWVSLPAHWLSLAGDMARELIGVLGSLSVALPSWFYLLWLAALGAALAGDALGDADAGRPGWARAVPIGLVILAAYGVVMSQYLSWTQVGAAAIDGVQGRYFLPLFGVLTLGTPLVRASGPGPAAIRALGIVLPIVAAGIGFLVVPTRVIDWYYLR